MKHITTKVQEATFNPKLTPANEVDLSLQPNIEVLKNPPEWKYVERILAPTIVPAITPKAEYPSGWKPQTAEAFKHPYFVRRTKNGMVPVYLKCTHRNLKKRTIIRHIKGDIWQLNHDIVNYVEDYMQTKLRVIVNEFVGQIEINGDYVNITKDYLMSKGF